MTSRFPPFAFVELVSPYNKKNITRWLEDMNFMFSWQEQYLTRSLRSLVRYCSCHSNIKFISSRHRAISSIYLSLMKESHNKTGVQGCYAQAAPSGPWQLTFPLGLLGNPFFLLKINSQRFFNHSSEMSNSCL